MMFLIFRILTGPSKFDIFPCGLGFKFLNVFLLLLFYRCSFRILSLFLTPEITFCRFFDLVLEHFGIIDVEFKILASFFTLTVPFCCVIAVQKYLH